MQAQAFFGVFSDAMGEAGRTVVSAVIALAEILTKSDASPGIVAGVFLIALIGCSAVFALKMQGRRRAVKQLHKAVTEHVGTHAFAKNFETTRGAINEYKDASKPWRSLWKGWEEYCETIVVDDVDGPPILRNSIRPTSFLNMEDLGFGPGSFRIVPSTFVSTGLLLTFLGLVAALHGFSSSLSGDANQPGVAMDSAMTDFMQIASAKFVMSLVGLFCSIIFTILMRRMVDGTDAALHNLCVEIERRLVFVSLEDIGFRQLRAATEQREHLREIGYGMVAELRAPLEALPEHITRSIAQQMDPIFEKVSNLGTSSMEGLVGDLSSQLSHSVGQALTRASESLGEASDRIGAMVDRMNTSNAQAGEGLQTALGQLATSLKELREEVTATGSAASSAMNEGAERMLSVMNDTLSGIRENTSQGAAAMGEAAGEMRKAAEGFREQLANAAADGAAAVEARMAASSAEASNAIDGAGKSLLSAFEATSAQIAKLGGDMGETVSQELLSRLDEISTKLQDMAASIDKGATGAKTAANGFADTANTMVGASETFSAASRDLVSAAEPLRTSQLRIEDSLRKLGATVENVSDTLMQNAKQIAESSGHVLETAQVALGNEREGIRQSMEATRAALGELSDQAERLDQIDQMLGRALSDYNTKLNEALGAAQDHISTMRDTLAPGLDTLRNVVEQAEEFMPKQKRSA